MSDFSFLFLTLFLDSFLSSLLLCDFFSDSIFFNCFQTFLLDHHGFSLCDFLSFQFSTSSFLKSLKFTLTSSGFSLQSLLYFSSFFLSVFSFFSLSLEFIFKHFFHFFLLLYGDPSNRCFFIFNHSVGRHMRVLRLAHFRGFRIPLATSLKLSDLPVILVEYFQLLVSGIQGFLEFDLLDFWSAIEVL